MSLLVGFDPSQVEDVNDNPLVPEGKYRVMLTDVVEDVSKSGTEFVRWEWVVVAGKHEDAKFECVHFPQSSEGSMKVFQSHTKSLCRALKLAKVKNYDDLLNKPVMANVKINKYTDKFGEIRKNNQINYFEMDDTGKKSSASTGKSVAPEPADLIGGDSQDDPPDFDDDMPF
ncbi:MAG: DUF669 domain-containing protein [Gammaproteobacteria bacterium AqS3]|nr:DUF669 domain-containing protein [Gammaproteobacteria bacterium AqS3]